MINCTAPTFELSNLPDPKGVPFQGVKDAKIPGRDSVAHLIDDFINKSKNDKTIQVCLIKAEWGEGKTDAFDRYIAEKLQDQHCFAVTTSTLAKKLRKLELETVHANTATNFLASLFAALGDDVYSQSTQKGIFHQEEIKDPVVYLNNLLAHLFENNEKYCYIFLDEFEEILYNDDVKADIISGIKELVNKKFGPLCDDGKYAGRLHLFIACTPHAWNTITEDPNFSQVMGSTEQRLSYNLVELPLLSRSDCYHFLFELTKVTYQGNLTKLPIASSGVFETIINISQRNPRALIQLFYRLMSKANKLNDNTIRCIDYSQILRDLRDVQLSIYGSSTPAIESENLEKFKVLLSDSKSDTVKVALFQLLVGESKPFSTQEIFQRLDIPTKEISNLVNQINEILSRKSNLELALETYVPLKEGKTIQSLLSRFPTLEDGKENYITVETTRIKLSKLMEILTNYVTNDDVSREYFKNYILIPANSMEFARLLSIENSVANTFLNIVRNDLDFIKKYYKSSINLLENIFPSPNLSKFDFIEDRSKRLEFRRRIQRDLGDLRNRDRLHNNLKTALVDSLEFANIKCKNEKNYYVLELNLDTKKIQIPILIEAVLENITQEKINELLDFIDKTPAVLTLLFYQSLEGEHVEKILEQLGEIQKIPIDRITIEQLLVWKEAKTQGIKINSLLERTRLSSTINELKLEHYLKDIWIQKALKTGIIIPDLQGLGDYGKSDIKPVITTFVSTSNLTSDEQWKFYNELNSIKLYNAHATFAPADIEEQLQWGGWTNGLEINHFISKTNDIVRAIYSPVEKRILQQINKNRGSLEQLKTEFVRLTDAKNALENYYLDTLIQKGKIQEKKDSYTIVKKDDAGVELKIKFITEFVSVTYPQNQIGDRFVSQTKQRDSRVIAESDYIQLIKKLLKKREYISDEDEFLRISKLIILIFDYYNEKFRPIVNEAQNKIVELFRDTKTKFDDLKLTVDAILNTYNNYCEDPLQHVRFDAVLPNLVKTFNENVEKEYKKEYDTQFVSETTNKIWQKYSKKDYKKSPFHFEQSDEQAFYFSLKYYNLHNGVEQFNNNLKPIQDTITKTREYVKKIKDAMAGIEATTATFVFDPKQRISHRLLDLTGKIKAPTPTAIYGTISLEHIEEFFSKVSERLVSFNTAMRQIISNLDELAKHEENCIDLETKSDTRLLNLKAFLAGCENNSKINKNTENALLKLKEIESELEIVKAEYIKLFGTIQNPIEELTEFVTRVTRTNSQMEQLVARLKQIDKSSNEIINGFIDDINSETRSLINFVNISTSRLDKDKQGEITSYRIGFEQYATKLKDKIERMR